jgi:hypothetical protein
MAPPGAAPPLVNLLYRRPVMARSIRLTFLMLVLASFAVGWRATPPASFNPRSMTLSGTRLFVSDAGVGVRMFDVADPAAPTETGLVPLRGNLGTAVKDDILYANEYAALVVLREGPDGYTEVTRLGDDYSDYIYLDRGGTRGFKGSTYGNGYGCACGSTAYAPMAVPSAYGSSYATFAVIGDYLYRVSGSTLVTYDISKPSAPVELTRTGAGWTIETIYPTDAFLFVGGTRGMYVFDRSNAEKPKLIARIEHVEACDPVVVSGTTAYVTLLGGNPCGAVDDQLLCVDIADPSHPAVIAEKNLVTPHGLAVRDPYLYVSNGRSGFTLLDVQRPGQPDAVGQWADRATRDFIWDRDTLYVLGDRDVHVFDVSDPRNPVYLATAGRGTL